jgi:hypothetical protein
VLRDLDIATDIIIGSTGDEHPTATVTELFAFGRRRGTVRVDVPSAQVRAAISSAGALVYTVGEDVTLAPPRSVLEAALAGTPLVLPAARPMRGLVDGVAHYYRPGKPRALANAIETAVNQPHPLTDRPALAERIREQHCAPDLFGTLVPADGARCSLGARTPPPRRRRRCTVGGGQPRATTTCGQPTAAAFAAHHLAVQTELHLVGQLRLHSPVREVGVPSEAAARQLDRP